MSKKLKAGDVIKPKKEIKEDLKSMSRANHNLDAQIVSMAITLSERRHAFWDLVYELYPESKNFHLSFDPESGTILVK